MKSGRCLPWKCIYVPEANNKFVGQGAARQDFPYRIYHMYSDRQALANSLDPDETPQNAWTTVNTVNPRYNDNICSQSCCH